MIVRTNTHEQEEWDSWIAEMPGGSFFQSFLWKTAQENVIAHTGGRGVGAVYTFSVHALDERGEVQQDPLACMIAIVTPLIKGRSMIVAPRGPVFSQAVMADSDLCFEVLQTLRIALTTQFPQALVWRMEPGYAARLEDADATVPHILTQSLQRAGGLRVKDRQPSTTRMLDTTQSLEDLLAQMKQKTRYNIRLAEKKEVHVVWFDRAATPAKDWEALIAEWNAIEKETAQRQGIRTHGEQYNTALLSAEWPVATLFFAVAYAPGSVQGGQPRIIGMNVHIVCNDTLTYLFGASTDAEKALMAPYALQNSAIEYAQKHGLKMYDLYGIAPKNGGTLHSLAGVTRFKEGFGGAVYEYAGTWEFPISPAWYRMYRGIQAARTVIKKIRSTFS